MPLIRDAAGIIMQHNKYDNNKLDLASGGDSCARTGPLAKAGYLIDIDNIPRFILPTNEVVRHPTESLFNTADKTSRDNIVQFFCADMDSQRASALHYAEKGHVNADVLMPDVRFYLYKVARKEAPALIKYLGPLWLKGAILWASYIAPDEEVNQLACMVSVLEPKYASMLLKHHSKFEANLKEYWDGWRDQKEVGEAILSNVKNQAAKNEK